MKHPYIAGVVTRAARWPNWACGRNPVAARLATVILMAGLLAHCAHASKVEASHPGLASALDRLVRAERSRDWGAMHAMLDPGFEQGRTSEKFADDMNAYAPNRSLVSWRATAILVNEPGTPISNWLVVEGCGCYLAHGQYVAWRTLTFAVPRGGGWRFDGIAIAGFADVPSRPCERRQVPEGPCKRAQK